MEDKVCAECGVEKGDTCDTCHRCGECKCTCEGAQPEGVSMEADTNTDTGMNNEASIENTEGGMENNDVTTETPDTETEAPAPETESEEE